MNKLSDEQLFRLFQNGDNKAFDQLVIKYKDRLNSFLYRIVNDIDLAEDLAQDTFVKVVLNKSSYKELFKFSTWMYTIAKRLAFTELRKKKRRKTDSISEINKGREGIPIEFSDLGSDEIDNEIMNIDKRIKIQKALSELPRDFRIIIVLRDIQELSYDHVSKIVEVPIGTVKSRIARARLKLAQLLKEKDVI